MAKPQTELYSKPFDKLNRNLTNRLATTFVSNDMVFNSKESVSLTATTSHFKRLKKKCFSCGGALHAGGTSSYPAKNRECYGCGKLGHYQKVRQSENKKTILASIQSFGSVNDNQ